VNRKPLWSGRFSKEASEPTLAFTSSLSFDRRLAFYDVLGSIAHARMLGAKGIIPSEETELIVNGLTEIVHRLKREEIEIPESVEDIHSAVELLLTESVGEIGGKLHTARSRNDQVVTGLRMYLRDALLETVGSLIELQMSLMDLADRHGETIMPGFTHMQHAQPITLGFHLMAHFFRFQRDAERFMESFRRVNVCPLGAAALAGTTYDIDRDYISNVLGFDRPTFNAMDSVSDRDIVAEYCFHAAMCMIHLSSLSEELVLWTSPEFGFAEMDDTFATGSSIMPQKKNPDVAELIRGRSGVVVGDLMSVLYLLKSLPLAYNRDLQEDKQPLFRSADTLNACLGFSAEMIKCLRFDPVRMREAAELGFINATDLADYLVTKGVPFRKAHETIGEAVRYAINKGKGLDDLSLEELRSFSILFEEDVREVLSLEDCVRRRKSPGGTSPQSVKEQIKIGRKSVEAERIFLDERRSRIQNDWGKLI